MSYGSNMTGPVFVENGIVGLTQSSGIDYYVDANAGADGNDGASWKSPLKTLTRAFVLSNATIVRHSMTQPGAGWAARNRIFYKGDNNEAAAETLITLPNKCDVIGVGSYDHRIGPSLIGNHVIGSAVYMGTRFINMGFQSPAAGGVIFTAPATTSGLTFIGCLFDGRSATPATKAILATGVEQLQIIGCNFFGKYSTTTIDIGTGSGRAMRIVDNFIESGAIGVTVHASYTCADAIGAIDNNRFNVVTLVVDENSNKVAIRNNIGSTSADGTVDLTIDYNAALSCNNLITCSASTTSIYPAQATIPT